MRTQYLAVQGENTFRTNRRIGIALAMVISLALLASSAVAAPAEAEISEGSAASATSYWTDGNNVGVITYLNAQREVAVTLTGTYEVLGWPAVGEAGVVTVRADWDIVADDEWVKWHAPVQPTISVRTQIAGGSYSGSSMQPREHLYTAGSWAYELRADQDYSWVEFQVDENWDRRVSATGAGDWNGPDHGQVARPIERGPDGITIEILDWHESVYDTTIDYTARVSVNAALVGGPDTARFRVAVWPGADPWRQTIPDSGGSVTFSGQFTNISESNTQVRVMVYAVDSWGSLLFYMTDRSIVLGYKDRPAEVGLELNEWYQDDAGQWWDATIYTHSLQGAAGEVCQDPWRPCRATIWAETATGQRVMLKNRIVVGRRGHNFLDVTNIGGAPAPIRDYTAVYVEITGSPVYGTTKTIRSELVPIRPPYEPDDVRVRAIEVTQAIQTWENSVKLVANKNTVARVFLEIEDESLAAPMSGRVVGSLNGVRLGGTPAYNVTPGGAVRPVQDATDPTLRRDIGSSLNFRLPRTWMQPGDLTLTFESTTGEVICGSAVGATSAECSVTVTVVEVPEVSVTFLGANHHRLDNNDRPEFYFTSEETLREQDRRVYSLLPTPWHATSPRTITDVFFFGMSTNGDGEIEIADTADVLEAVKTYRKEAYDDGCVDGCTNHYHGIAEGMSGGWGERPGWSASTGTSGRNDRWSGGYGRNTVVHEMGHNLGSEHSYNTTVPKEWSERDKSFRYQDGCGARAGSSSADSGYPFHGDISFRGLSESGAAILGLRGSPNSEPWGLDARTGSLYHKPDMTVMDPSQIGELLGYCRVSHPNDRWVSETNWNRWIESLQGAPALSHAQSSSDAPVAAERILVSGSVVLEEEQPQTAELAPVLALGAGTVENLAGPYILQAWRAGALVGTHPFELDAPADGHDIGHGEGEEFHSDERTFFVTIPVDAAGDYTEFRVVLDGEVLGTMVSALPAPEVKLVSPRRSSLADGESVSIAWNIDASPLEPVYSTVRYSSDGGDSWETIRLQTTDTQVSVPRSQLVGSDDALIQVKVSQGTKTAIAESQPFRVADNAPYVVDFESLDTPSIASGAQTIVQEAFVVDNEDGILTGDSITWTSHLDGVISTGEFLIRDAADFTPGAHVVTMTAVDSQGQSVSATTVLYIAQEPVYEYAEAPIAGNDYFALVSDLLQSGDYHPGTKRLLAAAYAQAFKEHTRGRTEKACDALDRASSLIDLREGQRNGLTLAQASELRELTRLLGQNTGCSTE